MPARALRLGLVVVDRTTDALTLLGLVAMVLVVSWQVFARFVLGFTPGWASEVALLLLCWLAFLGIAKGIREHSHIAVGFVVDRLPGILRAVAIRIAPALMAAFGGYLVIQGGEFTQLMMYSTLPATGLPTSVQYAAMPVAGVLIVVYSLLQLFGLIPLDPPDPGSDAGTAGSAPSGEGDDR
ncbi:MULTISPECIES: TRAP transporter small permease [Prauserella salsuginis group]|uniref:TRAP-type C4-dicarboxylate transport system permease small subunit n=2 Tax=Prauserella salsuginis group TaxID=2893672 RepID=A0A839XY96_9PSEU|nr:MULTISPECIES: TRAP transporter small permease [Prauserella salsuginis group]MBB3666334.1 TRAP-type C4-dicarboxylate transport system permease small subunit [Prauserella sediminis]MCR3722268.1 TRAP-type C4-dicarboxylate transport system, small permease component [Prauserella flava]MCR3736266.1 TRAP-type C4-dicarboxylate transport system, small permease component [Prauserella salsuginis]